MQTIPRFGYGTWKRYGDDAYRTVQQALEIGYRHIDTAEGYKNEEHVGRGIAESAVPRSEIFITTKVAPEHLGPGQVLPHVKISLEKLRVDSVDMLLVHWPSINDQYDINDYMLQLAAVRDMGLVKHIGVSNFTRKHLDAAIAILGADVIATNQVECHVLLQNRTVADHCRNHGIPVTAYSPLARGQLSGHEGIKSIAARHGATPEQVGLAFLLAEGHIVIPSSSNKERMQQNFDAQKLVLSHGEIIGIRGMDEGRRLVSGPWSPVWDV